MDRTNQRTALKGELSCAPTKPALEWGSIAISLQCRCHTCQVIFSHIDAPHLPHLGSVSNHILLGSSRAYAIQHSGHGAGWATW